MTWFDSVKSPKLKQVKKTDSHTPSGMWKKCANCGEILQSSKLDENHQVCPYCDHHFRLSVQERVTILADKNSFAPFNENIATTDPLEFFDKKSYQQRLKEAGEKNRPGRQYRMWSCQDRRNASRPSNHEFSIHGRLHGSRHRRKYRHYF